MTAQDTPQFCLGTFVPLYNTAGVFVGHALIPNSHAQDVTRHVPAVCEQQLIPFGSANTDAHANSYVQDAHTSHSDTLNSSELALEAEVSGLHENSVTVDISPDVHAVFPCELADATDDDHSENDETSEPVPHEHFFTRTHADCNAHLFSQVFDPDASAGTLEPSRSLEPCTLVESSRVLGPCTFAEIVRFSSFDSKSSDAANLETCTNVMSELCYGPGVTSCKPMHGLVQNRAYPKPGTRSIVHAQSIPLSNSFCRLHVSNEELPDLEIPIFEHTSKKQFSDKRKNPAFNNLHSFQKAKTHIADTRKEKVEARRKRTQQDSTPLTPSDKLVPQHKQSRVSTCSHSDLIRFNESQSACQSAISLFDICDWFDSASHVSEYHGMPLDDEERWITFFAHQSGVLAHSTDYVVQNEQVGLHSEGTLHRVFGTQNTLSDRTHLTVHSTVGNPCPQVEHTPESVHDHVRLFIRKHQAPFDYIDNLAEMLVKGPVRDLQDFVLGLHSQLQARRYEKRIMLQVLLLFRASYTDSVTSPSSHKRNLDDSDLLSGMPNERHCTLCFTSNSRSCSRPIKTHRIDISPTLPFTVKHSDCPSTTGVADTDTSLQSFVGHYRRRPKLSFKQLKMLRKSQRHRRSLLTGNHSYDPQTVSDTPEIYPSTGTGDISFNDGHFAEPICVMQASSHCGTIIGSRSSETCIFNTPDATHGYPQVGDYCDTASWTPHCSLETIFDSCSCIRPDIRLNDVMFSYLLESLRTDSHIHTCIEKLFFSFDCKLLTIGEDIWFPCCCIDLDFCSDPQEQCTCLHSRSLTFKGYDDCSDKSLEGHSHSVESIVEQPVYNTLFTNMHCDEDTVTVSSTENNPERIDEGHEHVPDCRNDFVRLLGDGSRVVDSCGFDWLTDNIDDSPDDSPDFPVQFIPNMPTYASPFVNSGTVEAYWLSVLAPLDIYNSWSFCIVDWDGSVATWIPRNQTVVFPDNTFKNTGRKVILGVRFISSPDLQFPHAIRHPKSIIIEPTLKPSSECHTCRVAELCSGAGTLGNAFEVIGHSIVASIELQPVIADVLQHNISCTPTVADVRSSDAVKTCILARPHIIVGGFPCQPWSWQGQRLGLLDGRGNILFALVRCLVLSGANMLCCECVDGFPAHEHARHIIQSLLYLLPIHCCQVHFDLESLWCAKRCRWLAIFHFEQREPFRMYLPLFRYCDFIGACFGGFDNRDTEDPDLELNEVEQQGFSSARAGPLRQRLLSHRSVLPTILHSYGNIWSACPCHCRDAGFSNSTLARGIRGPLCEKHSQRSILRYLAPSEICAFSCVSQQMHFGHNRLALSLIGLAAPTCLGIALALNAHSFLFPTNIERQIHQAVPMAAALALPLDPRHSTQVDCYFEGNVHTLKCSTSYTVKTFVARFLPSMLCPYLLPVSEIVLQWSDCITKVQGTLFFVECATLKLKFLSERSTFLTQKLQRLFPTVDQCFSFTVQVPWSCKQIVVSAPVSTTYGDLRLAVQYILHTRCFVLHGHHTCDDNHNIFWLWQFAPNALVVRACGLRGGAGKSSRKGSGRRSASSHSILPDSNVPTDPLATRDPWIHNNSTASSSATAPAPGTSTTEVAPTSVGSANSNPGPHKLLCNYLSAHNVLERFVSSHATFLIKRLGKSNVKNCFSTDNSDAALLGLAKKHFVELLPDNILPTKSTSTASPVFAPDITSLSLVPNMWVDEASKVNVPILTVAQVTHSAHGIALVTLEEAAAFVDRTEPLSTKSLAVLILTNQDPSFTRPSQKHKIALKHSETGQLFVFACWLVQLGQTKVLRANSDVCIPQAAPSQKVLFVLYRNSEVQNWEACCANPIKTMLEHPSLQTAQLQTATLSVLDKRISLAKTDIRVILLLKIDYLDPILKASGAPYFIVPLDDTGKPDAKFRPIWLGQADLSEAKKRASLDDRCLGIVCYSQLHQGERKVVFAVRVRCTDLPTLRPIISLKAQNSDYIAALYKFEACPLAAGLDKTEIAAMFLQHEWRCRPLIPKPGTEDCWILASDSIPPKFVFAFKEGDIALKQDFAREQRPPARTSLTASSLNSNWHRYTSSSSTSWTTESSHNAADSVDKKLEDYIRKQDLVNVQLKQQMQDLGTSVRADVGVIKTELGKVDAKQKQVETSLVEIHTFLQDSMRNVSQQFMMLTSQIAAQQNTGTVPSADSDMQGQSKRQHSDI